MASRRASQWFLVATACLLALTLVETAGRLLMRPDPRGYGSLFGVVLPPMRWLPAEPETASSRESPYRDLVIDGHPITVGDVAGYHRLDPVLGYTTLENAASVNGWWQSNAVGARESVPTEPLVAPGQTRWLLFGESFAQGSGLPEDQGWAAVADVAEPAIDIVNLAVDGYSMAQSYLRYEGLAGQLQHHGVLLMFVPGVDLWRDINVVRELGEPWTMRAVMPRFVLAGDGIRLVASPYRSPEELERDNQAGLGPRLREHLRRYDRFYFPLEFQSVPVVGGLLSFKIAVAAWGRYARGGLRRAQFAPGSEAADISHRIFLKWQEKSQDKARDFVLLVLPTLTDLDRLHGEPAFARQWDAFVSGVCGGIRYCVDLAPALTAVPRDEVDLAPDGNHFGARMNAAIAATVRDAIPR